MSNKKAPLWGALTSYLVAYLWIAAFFAGFAAKPELSGNGWLILCFTVVFFAWGLGILKPKAACREHWFWLAVGLSLALSGAVGRGRAVGWLLYPALHLAAGYWALCRGGLLSAGESGILLPWDVCCGLLVLPFSQFFLRIVRIFTAIRDGIQKVIHRKGKQPVQRKDWLPGVLAILAALPALLLAGRLLGQADPEFARVTETLFSFQLILPNRAQDIFLRLLFAAPVGCYLFGMVGGNLLREKPILTMAKVREVRPQFRVAPKWSVYTVLGGFLGLYLLFFAVQAKHLLAAFAGTVPGTLTAAAYAREGFFQLCLVMGINFSLLLAVRLFSREKTVWETGLSAGLMGESILLAVTAASKLILYINRFGFTPLRLLSAWGILVLTAGCVLAIGALFGWKKTAKIWILFAAATFTALCWY